MLSRHMRQHGKLAQAAYYLLCRPCIVVRACS
jgi:hypothetical protein